MNPANDYQRSKTNFKSKHTILWLGLSRLLSKCIMFRRLYVKYSKIKFPLTSFKLLLKRWDVQQFWIDFICMHEYSYRCRYIECKYIQYQEVSSMLLTNFKGVYRKGGKGGSSPLELRAITHINERRALLYRLQLFYTSHNYFLDQFVFFYIS